MSDRSPEADEAPRADAERPPWRGMTLPLTAFVLVGAPLVLYVWETLSALLAGHVDPRSLAIALVLGVIFLSAVAALGRHLRRVETSFTRSTEETDHAASPRRTTAR